MSHSQAEITQGQRQTHPHGQLDPDQQTGLEWVAVISNIKLRHDSLQILLKMKPVDAIVVIKPKVDSILQRYSVDEK